MVDVAVIGANGIGSFLLRGLDEGIDNGHISLARHDVTIIDDDHVEMKNTKYAKYTKRDVGGKKAIISGRRYGFKHKVERVTEAKQLEDFDLVILSADNNKVRRLVQSTGKPFIDVRAEGRQVVAFDMTEPTEKDTEEYLKLTPENDEEGSCQREDDLANGTIQNGNRIAAEIGVQKLITHLRGEAKYSCKTLLNV